MTTAAMIAGIVTETTTIQLPVVTAAPAQKSTPLAIPSPRRAPFPARPLRVATYRATIAAPTNSTAGRAQAIGTSTCAAERNPGATIHTKSGARPTVPTAA